MSRRVCKYRIMQRFRERTGYATRAEATTALRCRFLRPQMATLIPCPPK
jgi:hypothetical protein